MPGAVLLLSTSKESTWSLSANMLILPRMPKVSNRAVSRQVHGTPQASLPRTLLSIAALSVNIATDPHVGKSNRTTLEILQQAVRLTKPWIEAVLEDIVEHFPSLAQHHSQPAARRTRSLQDKSRLEALVSLLSVFWKVSKLLRSGNGVPRQVRVLSRLHSALTAELASAEREIERLKALLDGQQGGSERRRRRRHKDTLKMSEDEWEDVATVEGIEDLSRNRGRVEAAETALPNGELHSEAQCTEAQEAVQDSRKSPSKTSKSPPTFRSSTNNAQEGLTTSERDGNATTSQQIGAAQIRASSKASSCSKVAESDRASHESRGKSSKSTSIRGDSQLFKVGSSKASEEPRKASSASSKKSSGSRSIKDKGIWSPATPRSGTASTMHKQNAAVEQATSSKADSPSPQRGRRITPKDLNKTQDAVKAAAHDPPGSPGPVAPGNTPRQEITDSRSPEDKANPNIHDTDTTRSYIASRASSKGAKRSAANDAASVIHGSEFHDLLVHKKATGTRSKTSSEGSKKARSKASSRNTKQEADHPVQPETGKSTTSPSSCRSWASSRSHKDGRVDSTSSKANSPSSAKAFDKRRSSSCAKASSKKGSISPDAARQTFGGDVASSGSSTSSSTKKDTPSHHAAQMAIDEQEEAIKRTESVNSSRSSRGCPEPSPQSRPRKCHHTGSLASSGCNSKAWSCELSLDAQGVLQLKAEHFHRRPDGC